VKSAKPISYGSTKLTISTGGVLFIRNWYEYEDLFLVRRVLNDKEFDKNLLPPIVFEGYQDYQTTLKAYDNVYWQIYPFGIRSVPEPSTYGAILGAVGLGLWTWKKRKRKLHSSPDAVGEDSVA